VRTETGCTIIAVENRGERVVNPGPDIILPAGGTLLLIGTLEAEERFLKHFAPDPRSRPKRVWWKRKSGRL
jgi:K+/H+ antiporter YhaU regulatory subunit KhtT